MSDADNYPNVMRIRDSLLKVRPEHIRFLDQSFAKRNTALMAFTERLAGTILRVIGEGAALAIACDDYYFLCDKFLEEEVYFRRHGTYRLSRFEDAREQVYADNEFMQRYMGFMLLSHVVFDNHTRALDHFNSTYLNNLPAGTEHLEIGPGHGLLLHLACSAPAIAGVTGWDVSQTSINNARKCLTAMGETRAVDLILQDLFDAPPSDKRFGSVVIAEVLEHLEDPAAALRSVGRHMIPGGHLWIHLPVNSPAPDHIYLVRTPEEAVDLVRSAGFERNPPAGPALLGG